MSKIPFDYFTRDTLCPEDPTALKRFVRMRELRRFKHSIIQEVNPKTMVELGVRAGYSAYAFCKAIPGLQYQGFDMECIDTYGDGPWTWWARKLLKSINANFKITIADTQLMTSVPVVDFYHVDGDHSVKGVMHDLDMCFAAMPSHGVILVDDYTNIRKVRKGVNMWLKLYEDKIVWEFRKTVAGDILIRHKK